MKNKTKGINYTKRDYKEWGRMGGRPTKWGGGDAERKRWMRQQKALAEGRELRGYKSYLQTISTDPKKWKSRRYCPRCKKDLYHEKEARYCECGFWQAPDKTIFLRAGTQKERDERKKKIKEIAEKKEEDDDEEEEE